VEHYFRDLRAAYRLSMGLIEGERAANHVLSGSRYYREGGQVGAGVSLGREVERASPDILTVSRVPAANRRGVYWVAPRLGLTYGAGFHRYQKLYDRSRFELGVRTRF
jgi:hypothetical protein